MDHRNQFPNLWTEIPFTTPGGRTSVVKMTSFSQTSTDGGEPMSPTGSTHSSQSSGSNPSATFTSHIEMSPGLCSRTTRTVMTDNNLFPEFEPLEPITLPAPSPFFDPFFAQVPFPRLNLFQNRRIGGNNVHRRPIMLRDQQFNQGPSSGYSSSASSSSLDLGQRRQRPNFETTSSNNSTPINSPVPSMAPSMTPSVATTTSSTKSLKDNLVRVLDEVDARVRFLRETANELEEEKEKLINVLSSLEKRNELAMIEEIDREEVVATSKQLSAILQTVNITVSSKRDVEQEKAFNHVTSMIDKLAKNLESNIVQEREDAKVKVQVYLNTCTSANDSRVAIDEKFQKAIIACTIDDQKKLRKKLEALHKHTP